MASTISAGTSAGTAIAIAGDTSGNLAFTTQAGTYTQTLPNVTGTVMVNGPAFSATKVSATQSITTNTWTKVTFDTEEFDTASCFASSRFTPTVAGYYQVNGQVDIYPTVAGSRSAIRVYKNGSAYKSGSDIQISGQVEMGVVISALAYCNGTTDYLELYALMTATSPTIQNYSTCFEACLIRSA